MRKYFISQLKPGMVTATPVTCSDGKLVLDANTVLNEQLISRLKSYGVMDLFVKVSSKDSTAHPSELAKQSSSAEETQQFRFKTTQKSKAFQKFEIEYVKRVTSLQTEISKILLDTKEELDIDRLLESVSNLAPDSQSSMDLFYMLHNLRQMDDSIYAHSLNVALIARMFAKWLKYSQEDIKTVVLCGLLHDIGKTALPPDLLNKPGKYTPEEFEMAKQHAFLGYNILRERSLDQRIKNAALMHHERCDGSGYPNGLSGDKIDEFAMIVAISDVYDSMTSARSYHKPFCPFQVIKLFQSEGLQKYPPRLILTFLENVAHTYQHYRVLLNNGQTAVVAMVNPRSLTQPYLQFDDNTTIDMRDFPDLEIISIL